LGSGLTISVVINFVNSLYIQYTFNNGEQQTSFLNDLKQNKFEAHPERLQKGGNPSFCLTFRIYSVVSILT
jgi:hypothetical protein